MSSITYHAVDDTIIRLAGGVFSVYGALYRGYFRKTPEQDKILVLGNTHQDTHGESPLLAFVLRNAILPEELPHLECYDRKWWHTLTDVLETLPPQRGLSLVFAVGIAAPPFFEFFSSPYLISAPIEDIVLSP